MQKRKKEGHLQGTHIKNNTAILKTNRIVTPKHYLPDIVSLCIFRDSCNNMYNTMSRQTLVFLSVFLLVSTLSQVNGDNSKISTFEAADNALFVATIGFSGPAITSYQQENLHNALFDNKNEDKIEEDHWKEVSIQIQITNLKNING